MEREQDFDFVDDDATIFDELEVRVETELSMNTSSLDNTDTPMLSLPPFGKMTYSQASEEFSKAIDEAYSQTVHWIPNLFMLPSGNSGKVY